ncbi:MAG: (3R)-hydroxyacyl-ACP dehydratase subunit HadB [Bacteriovoracaceae bacterium]|nr:(3R)-hydroxyacyl-ACP dehydratase subunit HadB [Bacteriovoracaceae bacterium]
MKNKSITFETISREQIKDYCQASGDWNKIHWDESFAKEAGLPSIIAHGMLSMGLAARALAELGYDIDSLQNFDSKFKDKALPGDILTAEIISEGPKELQLSIKNQKGDEILTASCSFK